MASVLLDNPVGDRQPKASSLPHRLGGEKRFEDPRELFLGDAAPGVFNPHFDKAAMTAGGDADLALGLDGLPGVDQEVHEDLVQAAGIAVDRGNIAILLLNRAFVFEFVPDDIQGGLQALIDVRLLQLLLVQAGKALQIQV